MADRQIYRQYPPRQPPRRRSWRWWQVSLLSLVAAFLGGALGLGGLVWHLANDLPPLDQLETYQPSLVTQVYSSDQQRIGQFFIERRIQTPLAEIPERFRRAVIAVEDVRFLNIRDSITSACSVRPGRMSAEGEGRGGQHDYPAVGAIVVPLVGTHLRPQGPRTDPGL